MRDNVTPSLHALVYDWMVKFDVNLDLDLQDRLIAEEAAEVLDVFIKHPEPTIESCTEFLKESGDLLFTMIGYSLIKQALDSDRPISMVTGELASRAFLAQLTFISLAPEVDLLLLEAFIRVVESNMTKLDDDGLPIKNEAGKIMKGPNYKEPDLTDLAEKFLDAIA